MTTWGVYDVVTPPHVMPVDEHMFAIGGHMVSEQCWCKPAKIDATLNGEKQLLIVHNHREKEIPCPSNR